MIPRMIKLPIDRKSFFLLGPRQVGKSTLVQKALEGKEHIAINLLLTDELLKYKAEPSILRREMEYALKRMETITVFIDEIQRAPDLLNEIHYLLEAHKGRFFFILTGSSARKLRRGSANLLAGRAWELFLHPLTHIELGKDFSLNETLLKGSLPPLIQENYRDAFRTLRAYTNTYLKEEILDEALVRNIPAFSRFLTIAADQSGNIVNYSTIGRETGVNSKTVQGYYQILEDTLIAAKLEPYLKSMRKRLVRHPKYYLFDLGVINSITGRTSHEAIKAPMVYGRLFEHFIILEIIRYLSGQEYDFHCYHWRSSHGAEVDLVVEKEGVTWAIEIKSISNVRAQDLRGLNSFMSDYPEVKPVCVSTAKLPYQLGEITVIPWKMLFKPDWLG